MTFAQVLEQAIDVAENGFPIGDGLARAIAGTKKIQKYPTSKKVYFPNGKAPHPTPLSILRSSFISKDVAAFSLCSSVAMRMIGAPVHGSSFRLG